MTSTGSDLQAGAKKWVIVVLSGLFIFEKILSAGMELVLEVMIVFSLTIFSRLSKIFCFRGMFSVAASITRSQFFISS